MVLVAPLPKDSSCIVGIDPGITALPAVPDVDDFDIADIVLPQFPAVAEVEELCGGDVTAKMVVDSTSLPQVLSHKPALSTCEACMVGKNEESPKIQADLLEVYEGFRRHHHHGSLLVLRPWNAIRLKWQRDIAGRT